MPNEPRAATDEEVAMLRSAYEHMNVDASVIALAHQRNGLSLIARIESDAKEIGRLRNVEQCHLARTASLAAGDGPNTCGQVLVPIPEHVWPGIHEFDPTHPEYGLDDEGRKCLSLDPCIVPAVRTLWDAGFLTMSCCCGHGSGWGVITVRPSCTPPTVVKENA